MLLKTLILVLSLIVGSMVALRSEGVYAGDSTSSFYTCPMHPNVKSESPGECPICHMKLEKVEKEESKKITGKVAATKRKIRFYRNPMDPQITSPHLMKDSMGMGYIPVFEEEDSGAQNTNESGRATIKLTHQQFSNAQIKIIEVKKKTLKSVLQLSGGVYTGSSGKGTTAIVYLRVPEAFVSLVKSGQEVEVVSPAIRGFRLKGRITGIDYNFDPFTRTARATAQVRDDSGWLRTEVSITGTVLSSIVNAVVIPEQSVMHTGPHDLVYVDLGNGKFEPRIVQLGVKSDGEYEVQKGLNEGEKISEGPNFLIDSEARIRAAYD